MIKFDLSFFCGLNLENVFAWKSDQALNSECFCRRIFQITKRKSARWLEIHSELRNVEFFRVNGPISYKINS